MRLGLVAALTAMACSAPAPSAHSQPATPAEPSEKQRCRSAPGALADALGQALEQRVQASASSEEAALSLLELTPEQPRGKSVLNEALEQQGLTREGFGRCLEQDAEAYATFQGRLREHVESARARARGLPELSASEEGCQRLLPMAVSAKEDLDWPIALAARMVLPCAGRVTERELFCAISQGKLTQFTACVRGEIDPPTSTH